MTSSSHRPPALPLAYRVLWHLVTWPLGLAGGYATSAAQPDEGLLVGGGALFAVVVTVHLRPGWSWFQPTATLTRIVVVMAGGWAGIGLILLAGQYGVLAVVVVGATSPHVLARVLLTARPALYWCSRVPALPAAKPNSQELPGVRDESAAAVRHLCHAWRSSHLAFQRLQLRGDVVSQVAAVAARQICLDELERRDTAGFDRWLAAGARPGSDPSRYITGTPPLKTDGTLA